MTDPQPAAPPPSHQVAIEIPANLEAIYSNFVLIAHSPSEMVVDFARMLPNMPQARVYARIVMTPMNAKLLMRALGENLSRYEAQFGEIVVPTGLAEQLFKTPKPE
jgi:Protein of unknown function (DUF3467)